jgi:hypothetical protein
VIATSWTWLSRRAAEEMRTNGALAWKFRMSLARDGAERPPPIARSAQIAGRKNSDFGTRIRRKPEYIDDCIAGSIGRFCFAHRCGDIRVVPLGVAGPGGGTSAGG